MEESSVAVRIPASLIELYKELYDLPTNVSTRKVILYSIATSIPTRGMDNFIEDFKLDKKTVNNIIAKRDKYTKKANTEIQEINTKLDNLTQKSVSNNNTNNDDSKLDEVLNLLYLMSTEVYSASTDENEVANLLNAARTQSLKSSIEKQTK